MSNNWNWRKSITVLIFRFKMFPIETDKDIISAYSILKEIVKKAKISLSRKLSDIIYIAM